MMQPWAKAFGILVLALAVPIVPFVIWGQQIEAAAGQWEESSLSLGTLAAILFGLLALDIVLPVPSSLVNTIAGAKLGLALGGLTCFLGLSVGAGLGFGLARFAGPALRRKMLTQQDVQILEEFANTWGATTLVATRALPILAEAAVVALGIQGLSWKKFWPPVLLANGGIAIAYAAFGEVAAEQEWLVVALAVSAGMPLMLALLIRHWLRARRQEPSS